MRSVSAPTGWPRWASVAVATPDRRNGTTSVRYGSPRTTSPSDGAWPARGVDPFGDAYFQLREELEHAGIPVYRPLVTSDPEENCV